MHFRLVYPKLAGQVPLWPQINSEGRTIWPDGDDELLRPVYTVRQFDMQAQTLDFDVFLHDGGRTTDWAKGVGIGAKVGLLGPSGGGVPEADFMLLLEMKPLFLPSAGFWIVHPAMRGELFFSAFRKADQKTFRCCFLKDLKCNGLSDTITTMAFFLKQQRKFNFLTV